MSSFISQSFRSVCMAYFTIISFNLIPYFTHCVQLVSRISLHFVPFHPVFHCHCVQLVCRISLLFRSIRIRYFTCVSFNSYPVFHYILFYFILYFTVISLHSYALFHLSFRSTILPYFTVNSFNSLPVFHYPETRLGEVKSRTAKMEDDLTPTEPEYF